MDITMKTSVKYLLVCLICSATIKSLTALQSNNNPLSGKRKPLVSRDDAEPEEDYKRIKRQTNQPLQEFQEFVTKVKQTCATEMGMTPNELEKTYLYEENPTHKEKCLMQCILKRIEVMGKDNNLSPQAIGRIADIISNKNILIISIAVASAENCRRFIHAKDPCEAAFQINKCIANELRGRRIKLIY